MDAAERGLGQHAGHLQPTAIFTAENDYISGHKGASGPSGVPAVY